MREKSLLGSISRSGKWGVGCSITHSSLPLLINQTFRSVVMSTTESIGFLFFPFFLFVQRCTRDHQNTQGQSTIFLTGNKISHVVPKCFPLGTRGEKRPSRPTTSLFPIRRAVTYLVGMPGIQMTIVDIVPEGSILICNCDV